MTLEDFEDQFVFVDALGSARLGEPEGFDQLYRRFSRSIFLLGVFECFSQPDSLVDSILSEAFAQVGVFIGSEPNFAGQLFCNAMDQIVTERQAHSLEPDDHVRCSLTNFDEEIDSERLLRLHDAVHWLAGPERRVLHLRITFGLNLLQVARVLALPISEVRELQDNIEFTLTSNLPAPPPMPGAAYASAPEVSVPL